MGTTLLPLGAPGTTSQAVLISGRIHTPGKKKPLLPPPHPHDTESKQTDLGLQMPAELPTDLSLVPERTGKWVFSFQSGWELELYFT